MEKKDKAGVSTRAGRKASSSTVNKSAVTDHAMDNNHVIGWGDAKVIGKEENRYKRWVKEAMEIRKRKGSTMNRDEGQYNLSHVFDEFLQREPRGPAKTTKASKTGNTASSGNTDRSKARVLPVA